ncbi:DUF4340 domain-containing protein [Lacunimicrobium album]
MNELSKTMIFVGLAVVLVGAAAWSGMKSQGADEAEFAQVGKPFYPDFTDPNDANGLNLVRYDEDTATGDRFSIQSKNGKWVIPSHYDYPADAKDQLAKTAASVVGIERGALVGRRSADFERLGVIDPGDEESTAIKGRGNRITLVKDGTPLTDLIIGKKAEGGENMYYVRRPDEDQTYVAAIDIDLSTKFTDWIEDDLLSLAKTDLEKIVIHRYSVDEGSGRIVDQGFYTLSKPEGSEDCKLEDLKPEEEMQIAKVNGLIDQLDDLRIVGIRRKPEGLSADLKTNKDVSQDILTSMNLQSKGFYFSQNRAGEMRLVSNEGELAVMTKDGLTYVMHFGAIVAGDDEEIEVGFAKKKDEEKKEGEAKEETPSIGKNRYLFLTVNFDPAALGEKPVAPVKPEEPKAEEATPAADPATAASPAEGQPTDSNKVGEIKADPKAMYEVALKEYETKQKQYEAELKVYDAKVEAAKKKAKELNARFADWYYVISGDSFEEFSLKRADLVKAKLPTIKEEAEAPVNGEAPAAAGESSAAPAAAMPAEEKPEAVTPPVTTGEPAAGEPAAAGTAAPTGD